MYVHGPDGLYHQVKPEAIARGAKEHTRSASDARYELAKLKGSPLTELEKNALVIRDYLTPEERSTIEKGAQAVAVTLGKRKVTESGFTPPSSAKRSRPSTACAPFSMVLRSSGVR